jgi:hypothetical protein
MSSTTKRANQCTELLIRQTVNPQDLLAQMLVIADHYRFSLGELCFECPSGWEPDGEASDNEVRRRGRGLAAPINSGWRDATKTRGMATAVGTQTPAVYRLFGE